MNAIDSITHSGDLLEREVFQDLEFAGAFHTYAQLWDSHLRTRRTSGIYIAGDWEMFSQRHYAAIVRAYEGAIVPARGRIARRDSARIGHAGQ